MENIYFTILIFGVLFIVIKFFYDDIHRKEKQKKEIKKMNADKIKWGNDWTGKYIVFKKVSDKSEDLPIQKYYLVKTDFAQTVILFLDSVNVYNKEDLVLLSLEETQEIFNRINR